MKALITGSLVGGVVLFLWGAVSWMLLPWHQSSFQKFAQENVVEVVLATNGPQGGVYLLPNPQGRNPEEAKLAKEKIEKGPFAFVVMNPQGSGPVGRNLLVEFLIQGLGALFVTTLLIQKGKMSYWDKVSFVTLFGFTAGVVCLLPNWNWWGFPYEYTILGMVDLVIGWFLAGLALAKVT